MRLVKMIFWEEQFVSDFFIRTRTSALCTRCSHQVFAFGTGSEVRMECAVRMQTECRRHERNEYVGTSQTWH